jgi:hypothetical protein
MKKRGNEGIDKIKLKLSRAVVNTENFKHHIDPQNRITLHREGPDRSVSIHNEYIDPKKDCREICANALFELQEKKVIVLPDRINSGNRAKTVENIRSHIDEIAQVKELELYSDLPRESISIDEEGNNLIKCFDTTYYSQDYKNDPKHPRKSMIILDDRQKRLREQGNIPRKKIEGQPPVRMEFRLTKSNCGFLSMDNLKGNSQKVFRRHTPYLATKFNAYIAGSVDNPRPPRFPHDNPQGIQNHIPAGV